MIKSSLAELTWDLETEATDKSGQKSSLGGVRADSCNMIKENPEVEEISVKRSEAPQDCKGGIDTNDNHRSTRVSVCASLLLRMHLGLKSCPHSHACTSGQHSTQGVGGQELQEAPVALGAFIFFWKLLQKCLASLHNFYLCRN